MIATHLYKSMHLFLGEGGRCLVIQLVVTYEGDQFVFAEVETHELVQDIPEI